MGIIVFLGDSITDADRKSTSNQLGNGYVNIFSENLDTPDRRWTIVNRGTNGYITERVAEGLRSDCISLHPDYVSILTGINNIGLIVNADTTEQEKLYMLEDAIRAYHEMLFDLSRETIAKIVTLEPFVFPSNGMYEDWVPWQEKMSKNIKKLARNYGASFVPLQEPLNEKIQQLGYDAITTDGIHLTSTGHKVLAEIVSKAFGL